MAEPGNPNRYPGYRRVDVPSLDREKAALREKVVGQEEAVASFASLYVKIKSGVRPIKPSPLDAKFLLGPSGVGKTELVYALAELLADGDPKARDKVIKINGGDYQDAQRHGISRLFGVPPGFVGAERPDEPGSGAKAIFSPQNLAAHKIPYIDRSGRQKNVNLVLIDEAEKAGKLFHMAFLSILDKGEADLANNSKADFRDAIFLYTSNIGNAVAEQQHGQRPTRTDIPTAFQEAVEDVVFKGEERNTIIREFTQTFPPEFRGRIQEPIVFNHLSHEAVSVIAQLKIKEVEASFAASGIRIELDVPADVREWLNKNGYDRSEGARGMDKLVKGQIMEKLLAFDAARDVDVLATGIHRKRIGVGVSEDGASLEFYFGEGYQLPDPRQRKEVVKATATTPVRTDKPREVIIQLSEKDEFTKEPPRPQNPPSSEVREVYSEALSEQKEWQKVLGVLVDVKPLPNYLTPTTIDKLKSLGMDLRYIPHLELDKIEDLKWGHAVLADLVKKYPNWKRLEKVVPAEHKLLQDPTVIRNLDQWFWDAVCKGFVDSPVVPGQWVAVETMKKPNSRFDAVQSSPITRIMGFEERYGHTPAEIQAAIDVKKEELIEAVGLIGTHAEVRLLEPVEWNLLANREGWGKTKTREWTSKKFPSDYGDFTIAMGDFEKGGASDVAAQSEWNNGGVSFRLAMALPEERPLQEQPVSSFQAEPARAPSNLLIRFSSIDVQDPLERASQVFGADFLGPEQIKKALGFEVPLTGIPRIPFSEREMEKAKDLGQLLILRVDKTANGAILNMHRLSGSMVYEEDFATKHTPRIGWALVSKAVLPGTTHMSYFQQTERLASYLKSDVFPDIVPAQYKEAIQEFELKKADIEQAVELAEISDDSAPLSQKLASLKLNQILRQTAVEVHYDYKLSKANQLEALNMAQVWTSTYVDGYLYVISAPGRDSWGNGYGWSFGPRYRNSYNLEAGVVFSRRF